MSAPFGLATRARTSVEPSWAYALRLLHEEVDGHLKAALLFALFLVLSASILETLSPIVLKLIVDDLSAVGISNDQTMPVALLVVGYAGSQWLSRSLQEMRLLAVGRIDQRLHRNLSVRLFKHVMELPLRFHLDRKAGALSQTLTNGLLGYRILVQHLVTTVLPVVAQLIMIGTVLLAVGQPIFLAVIGVAMMCYVIIFSVGAGRLTRSARAASSAQIDATGVLTDSVINYETIKCFCAEPRIQKRMGDAFTQTETRWVQFFSRKALYSIVVGTVFALSLGLSVYLSARQVQQDRMTLGDFVLVNAYMLQMFRPLDTLGSAALHIAQGLAFIERMVDVFREHTERTETAVARSLPPGPGEVVFDRVRFSYNGQVPVLRDICFTIPAGKVVALVGTSGTGKSSLIRLLVRFWEPDAGRILLDGIPISDVPMSSLRQAISIVPQDTVLFNDSIAYNIAIGRANSSQAEIEEAARLAHIHDYVVARPNGYQTLVGERGLKLSGGEKQRIAIARAALKRPRLFVFDEATSSLDSQTEQVILRNFAEISRGTTTLVIAHRLSTIVAADEILVVDQGIIAERGTHQSLLQRQGIYHAMWANQSEKLRSHRIAAV